MVLQIIQGFIAAIFLGGLIGLEREAFIQKNNTKRFAGIRTFALIGFLGAFSVYLSTYSEWLSYILLFGFVLIIGAAYLLNGLKSGEISALSTIAAIIVYFVGFLSGQNEYWLAIFITLLIFLIIHFEDLLHKFSKRIKEEELYSTIKFIVISLLILPILPDQGYGPYEIFNPFVIWLMVVFISGISFLSYITIKIIGVKRGIGLTGFLAGLASSTALTLSFSEQSNKNKKIVNPYVFGVVSAASAMFFRILAVIFVINSELFYILLIPLGAMGLTGLVSAIFFYKKKEIKGREKVSEEPMKLKSPFQLKPAIKFGLLFALVLFLSEISLIYFGSKGVYITSILSGIVDTDAITVSLSNLAENGLNYRTAMIGITIATMVNTMSKGVLFLFLGNRQAGISILKIFSIMIAVGGISVVGLLYV